MSLTVPPAKNYQSPLVALNSVLGRDPIEGPMQVPLEINWTIQGAQTGNSWAVFVNLQNQSTRIFSQVCGLKVDNSACGSDIQFVFTDTGEVITIDAYDPCAVVPVFSAQTQFYVVALNAIAGDVTRAQVLNFVPPPTAIPIGLEQNFAQTAGLPAGNVQQTLQLVPAGVNGTLQDFQVNFAMSAAPSALSQGALFVQDGSAGPNYLVNSLTVLSGPGQLPEPGKIILDMKDIRWRFTNGLKATWTPSVGWSAAGVLNFTTAYRTP